MNSLHLGCDIQIEHTDRKLTKTIHTVKDRFLHCDGSKCA